MTGGKDRARILYAIGVTLGGVVLVTCLALAFLMSHTIGSALVWGAALVLCTFVALVALLLLDPQREADSGDDTTSACVECGKPTRGEWRLCPHCGQVFNCEVTPGMGGRHNHG